MPAAIAVYDPPLCCPTGICGPNVDPELVRFAADMQWLEAQGVAVERYNLAQQPAAFVENPTVLALLNAEDTACLPVTIVGGEVVAKAEYPTREALAALLGLSDGE